MSKPFYSPSEFGEKAGASAPTVRHWYHSGYVRGVRVGDAGRIRIPASELDRLGLRPDDQPPNLPANQGA